MKRNSLHPSSEVRWESRSVKSRLEREAYKWVRLEKDTEREPEAIMIAILSGHTHHYRPQHHFQRTASSLALRSTQKPESECDVAIKIISSTMRSLKVIVLNRILSLVGSSEAGEKWKAGNKTPIKPVLWEKIGSKDSQISVFRDFCQLK
ncbi:hypothetical protein NPIL_622281 [Nephila pilipes]|uniref:Uncharacterized protein n=1 Tax=Nephila pilipes TaxID=299642 RepID=A0A8X6QP89_NEPPI|nr:hypothetical protein NPIL_622281 [Nephila pilipes]